MIIKSKTRKNRSFRQAINYVLREDAHPLFILTHNLKGDSPDQWVASFQKNENGRRRKRKNAVKVIHLILSWHQHDQDYLDEAAMKTMTRQIMESYNPHAVYLAVAHPAEKNPSQDKEQEYELFEDEEISTGPHVHIIAAGVSRFGSSLRLSKAQFRNLKIQAQQFQERHYPELVYSVIDHTNQSKSRQTEREYWLKRRGKEPTEKEKIQTVLKQAYDAAHSIDEFFNNIRKAGLTPYSRGGKITGVRLGKRKYRLRLFGYTQERLQEIQQKSLAEDTLERALERS